MTPFSIVVTTYEQCDSLRRLLPKLMEQEYSAEFEVIVVDLNSTDDTLLYLESMQKQYANLQVIRLPQSARDISPLRLALTLAFRAAAHEWVVVTQANCYPASSKWLAGLSEVCSADPAIQMVLGYTRFVNGKGWHGLRCRFFRSWQQLLHLPWAEHNGAYRCDGTNLCYRRDFFLEHKGVASDDSLRMGAIDIMVNNNSTAANTAVSLSPQTVMEQDTPRYRRWWVEERLYFMETRRHLHHAHGYRLKYLYSVLQTWLPTLLLAAIATFASWPFIILAVVLWLPLIVWKCYRFDQRLRTIGDTPIRFALPLLLHLIPLWDLQAWLLWLFTPKHVFRKKFI